MLISAALSVRETKVAWHENTIPKTTKAKPLIVYQLSLENRENFVDVDTIDRKT